MTAVAPSEPTPFSGNPIDLVEEIVSANDWAHDRASDEELVVEISGRWCDYRLYFVWQEELCAMHFSCGFDMKVPKAPPRRGLRAAGARQRKAVARPFRSVGGQLAGLSPRGPAARRLGGERRAGGGSRRYRLVGMRAVLSGVSARPVGRQAPGRGDGGGDDRPGRGSLKKAAPRCPAEPRTKTSPPRVVRSFSSAAARWARRCCAAGSPAVPLRNFSWSSRRACRPDSRPTRPRSAGIGRRRSCPASRRPTRWSLRSSRR